MPIPEDSDNTGSNFVDQDGVENDLMTRETVTRDSSNGFYKKSPKALNQESSAGA